MKTNAAYMVLWERWRSASEVLDVFYEEDRIKYIVLSIGPSGGTVS